MTYYILHLISLPSCLPPSTGCSVSLQHAGKITPVWMQWNVFIDKKLLKLKNLSFQFNYSDFVKQKWESTLLCKNKNRNTAATFPTAELTLKSEDTTNNNNNNNTKHSSPPFPHAAWAHRRLILYENVFKRVWGVCAIQRSTVLHLIVSRKWI